MIIKKKRQNSEEQVHNSQNCENNFLTDKQDLHEEKDTIESDFENLDFVPRNERRRGNRRRGYRRIDDRKLISRAQEEAITIKENAAQEGFAKGLEQAASEIAKIKENFCNVADIRKVVYKELSNDILDISIAIAKKIINKEISTDNSVIVSMISDALNECAKHETKIKIKVSNENYDFVKKSIPQIAETASAEVKISVIASGDITGNNIIIETDNGLMDISCDTQLSVLQEMFKTI